MTIPMFVIIILTIYVGIGQLDALSIQIGLYSPLFAGTITGLLLGDVVTGLTIGATLQLMTLGVATYGGASIPDFLSGAIIGTAYAIISGQGAEYGIGIAAPIGLLLIQLDILGRTTNTIFQHRAMKYAEQGNTKQVEISNILGIIPWTLTRMLPVFVGLTFGESVVTTINEYLPTWLMAGLKTAGSLLPAMGIAILMRYLPLKKYFPYYIIGFVIMAYGALYFNILGVALIGLALAVIVTSLKGGTSDTASGDNVTIDDEEVEIDG